MVDTLAWVVEPCGKVKRQEVETAVLIEPSAPYVMGAIGMIARFGP
jgi:hypothetical protein